MTSAIVPQNARGFTLVEMLVVLLIMGITVGLVSANLQPSQRDRLRVEAERLAQIMDLAAEESRTTGKSIAWTADASGYRFWRQGGDSEWSEIRDSDLLRARSMPHGMSISDFRVEAMGPQPTMRVEFPPGGAMLAFNVELSLGVEHYAIAASPIGDLRVSPGHEKTYAEMATQ